MEQTGQQWASVLSVVGRWQLICCVVPHKLLVLVVVMERGPQTHECTCTRAQHGRCPDPSMACGYGTAGGPLCPQQQAAIYNTIPQQKQAWPHVGLAATARDNLGSEALQSCLLLPPRTCCTSSYALCCTSGWCASSADTQASRMAEVSWPATCKQADQLKLHQLCAASL
jgi:hypothetical protein